MRKRGTAATGGDAIRVAAAKLSNAVRALSQSRSGPVRVRRPVNVRAAVNIGSSGATRTATAKQTAPITQVGGFEADR
jgi:hypothetical protein